MRKKHEQSVIDSFAEHFLSKGKLLGKQVNKLSVDGQDSLLGADYIFTATTNFALVEFKYEENDLKSERTKELRFKLCKMLDQNGPRLEQSLQCHFVAWSNKEQEIRKVIFNKYRSEICNKEIFPQSILKRTTPDKSTRVSANKLINDFFDGKIGTSFDNFNNYIKWLLKLCDKEGTNIEVMLDNPDSNELEILEFSSLELLNTWLIRNNPQPSPTSWSPSP